MDQNDICESCLKLRPSISEQSEGAEDIVMSFNTLQVTTDAAPHQPISCRQQEAVISNYTSRCSLDDTTVDELAAYLEEMMYLPKPMSEMAELMYT